MSKKQRKRNKIPAQATSFAKDRVMHTLNTGQITFLFVCAALAVSAFLHFSVDRIADPDAFYHFRHAELYQNDLFRRNFPWTYYSVIKSYASDLWYGFHLILIPFTVWRDRILSLQIAGIFTTFVFLILFYFTCRNLKIKLAPFWPFFGLFSSAFFLHRIGMLRPQIFSLGLSALIFAALVSQSIWGTFLVALATTFVHLNLFFVLIVIYCVFATVQASIENTIPWRQGLMLAAGVFVGWLLRPNPIGAGKILYVQLVQLSLEKVGGGLIDIGGELLPLRIKINSNYLLFILILAACLVYFCCRLRKKDLAIPTSDRTSLTAAGFLSFMFLMLALLFARRAFDFCTVFGVIFIGLIYSRCLYEKLAVRLVLFGAFVFLVPYGTILRNEVVLTSGWNPARFEKAARWIGEHSNSGDIVFNARWEYFPELFFWNSKDVYVSGMDPVFQYAYDEELYNEAYSLVNGPPNGEDIASAYKSIEEDFKAHFVVLAKPFDSFLYDQLARDNRFALVLDDEESVVFAVN